MKIPYSLEIRPLCLIWPLGTWCEQRAVLARKAEPLTADRVSHLHIVRMHLSQHPGSPCVLLISTLGHENQLPQ